MKRGEVLKLPVKRKRVKAEMSADLASELIPCETRPGVSLTSVTGRLILSDNKYKIEVSTFVQHKETQRKHAIEINCIGFSPSMQE